MYATIYNRSVKKLYCLRWYTKVMTLSIRKENFFPKKDKRIEEILYEISIGKKWCLRKVDIVSTLLYSEIYENIYITEILNELRKLDLYTYKHSLNVSFYAMLIGKWMSLSRKELQEIVIAGLLHDIGKIKIPLEILNKEGKLTHDEFEEIKKHSIYGFEIVKTIGNLSNDISTAILMHHERENQSGYPFEMKGSQLNIHAKIIAVADVYDAMTTDRIYKGRATPQKAFEMFQTEGLLLFDSEVVKTFITNLSPYIIY